ncbi:type II toxin-antitoxin system VapC family toxin [Mucilaginibacter flavus]|uniref:type II toxin-antitoxin system VapC family toxin n=1 Tax=Mucilaginibacter flavus TaxID=931504 RepID=UPI0025B583A6|nr:type II toxin-antitoxin system VapC family toxin [Mucilaginibacter flavus]MDN3581492.1 type II toxin-antitoxin system VapC family toxin [Mucilaginibacter flavus]
MAFLIDSNIIIYSYSNEYQYLRDIITDELSNISEISRVEVLGYYALKADERKYFNDIFNFVPVILPSQEIFNKAVEVRASYNLKLGDSIIAATALTRDLILYTRNVSDFNKIAGLKMVNPIK